MQLLEVGKAFTESVLKLTPVLSRGIHEEVIIIDKGYRGNRCVSYGGAAKRGPGRTTHSISGHRREVAYAKKAARRFNKALTKASD
jgi:hypothetical protein